MACIKVFQHPKHVSWRIHGILKNSIPMISLRDVARCIGREDTLYYWLKDVSLSHKQKAFSSDPTFNNVWCIDYIGFYRLLKHSDLPDAVETEFRLWIVNEVFPNIKEVQNMDESMKTPDLKQIIEQQKAQIAQLDIYARLDALEKKINSLQTQNSDQIDSISKNLVNLESKISILENYARESESNSQEIVDILKTLQKLESMFKKHIEKPQSNPFAPYFDTISDSKHQIESLSTQISQLQKREIDLRTKSRDVSVELLRRIEKLERFIAGFKTLFEEKAD